MDAYREMWLEFLDGSDFVSAPLFTVALFFNVLAAVVFFAAIFTRP